MRKFVWAMIGFLFTMGCMTTTKDLMPPSEMVLPPAFEISSERDREKLDYFYLQLAETNPQRHAQWWIKYRRAQLWKEENPVLSCERFAELGAAMVDDLPRRAGQLGIVEIGWRI